MRQKWGAAVIAAFLVLGLLLRGTGLLACGFGNAGIMGLRNALESEMARPDASLQRGEYALYEALPEGDARPQMDLLVRAAALKPNSSAIHWELARAALACGDAAAAVEVLKPIATEAEHNALLWQDLALSLSYAGMPSKVLALYEAVPPPRPTDSMSDTVALAYLEAGGQEALKEAVRLRPGDLYVNYHLWKEAHHSGDLTSAVAYSETLTYFPLEAIHPTDERLLDYAAEIIPALLDEGLWDRDKALNVVSFLVWQHPRAQGVEQLVKELIGRHHTEPDWPFYLAELYHRWGDLGRAEAAYRQVLALNPGYAQAYLRLGVLAEARQGADEHLEEAAAWYEQYHEIAPGDVLGLRKLMAVYEALGTPEAPALREQFEARTDDRRIVGKLLDVPVEDVELGPNLVKNGGFEERVGGRPQWWEWSAMFGREPFGPAAFAGGHDDCLAFTEHRTARVDGFWIQQQKGDTAPRAGFWHHDESKGGQRCIPLTASTPYLLSFQYRTIRVPDGKTTVWVSSADEPDLFWSGGNRGLPGTDGEWHHFVAVGWNHSDAKATIRLLFRLYAPGCVLLDDVPVRPIELPEWITL